ncbi:MAG: hypothetical protein RLZ35_265 [Pseudomonadota bacterium]
MCYPIGQKIKKDNYPYHVSHMTIILSIDTSTDACSIGLYTAVDNIQECFEIAPAQHTQLVLPQIHALLDKAGLFLSQVDAIAFGQGPGSFTGVRIASSVAQALGFGLQKPLIPVSGLRAIAQTAFVTKGYRQVLVTLDARLQAVYWGLYRVNADNIMEAVQPDSVGKEAEAIAPDATWIKVTGQYPHAREIAQIGAYAYLRGETVSACDAVPVYVRDNVV